jgi:hypothetical protein
MKLSTEATLQEERRLRIQVEKEFSELIEKYDILVSKTNSTKDNPDSDYLRTYRL